MSASLLLACGLNEQNSGPYIHISEESGVDGSFLISSILGQRLRIPNSGTVLVCLHHTFNHYLNAGLRLGYNLNMYRGKSLSVIEPVADIGKSFLNCEWLNNPGTVLSLLRKDIDTEIKQFQTHKGTVTVVMDNLGVLLNLDVRTQDLAKLPKLLLSENEPAGNVTLITKLNNSDVFETCDSNLVTASDMHLRVVRLKSGMFKEVDGKVVVGRSKCEGSYGVKHFRKEILYKVNDRSIKIFNPGEVGIKI